MEDHGSCVCNLGNCKKKSEKIQAWLGYTCQPNGGVGMAQW